MKWKISFIVQIGFRRVLQTLIPRSSGIFENLKFYRWAVEMIYQCEIPSKISCSFFKSRMRCRAIKGEQSE
jgi:hypothetical protein